MPLIWFCRIPWWWRSRPTAIREYPAQCRWTSTCATARGRGASTSASPSCRPMVILTNGYFCIFVPFCCLGLWQTFREPLALRESPWLLTPSRSRSPQAGQPVSQIGSRPSVFYHTSTQQCTLSESRRCDAVFTLKRGCVPQRWGVPAWVTEPPSAVDARGAPPHPPTTHQTTSPTHPQLPPWPHFHIPPCKSFTTLRPARPPPTWTRQLTHVTPSCSNLKSPGIPPPLRWLGIRSPRCLETAFALEFKECVTEGL